MSNTDGPFDWEDENDPVFISDEDFDDEETMPLEDFRRMIIQERIIKDFVEEAWEFGGIATVADILNHIERKVGWRTEVIAESSALDDYMFYKHGTFSPHIWDFYTNSDEYDELVLNVAYESEIAMQRFTKRVTGSTTNKDTFKSFGRKLAQKLVRYFD